MKFLADIEVEEGLKDSSGDLGSNGQILSSTGSGTNWITSNPGDITGVTAGTGLSGGGTSGTVTLNLDLGELAVGGTLIATDYLIAENGGVDNRQLISSIPLSIFNNNAGWTSNTGTVTSISASTSNNLLGLSSLAIGGAYTIGLNINGLTGINPSTPSSTDFIPIYDASGSVNRKVSVADLIATAPQGDITGVTAGSGLSGGGTSGTVTLTNSGVTQIIAGTNVTISPSGGTGNVTINASGGGGSGTIGGTIANQQIPVGTATDTIGGFGYFIYTPQSGLQLGDNSQTGGANIMTINRPSGAPGKFIIKQNNTTEFSIVTGGDTTISSNTNNLILTDDTTAKVGVGNTSPNEKLDVTGRIKASAGVQVGNETGTSASSGLVGTFRYRLVNGSAAAGTNYSYVDMCMQTDTTGGVNSYEWVNVVTNRW